jgi:hypothetical protein
MKKSHIHLKSPGIYIICTVGCKKNGNCQNKIDTFLQFFHSVKRQNLMTF